MSQSVYLTLAVVLVRGFLNVQQSGRRVYPRIRRSSGRQLICWIGDYVRRPRRRAYSAKPHAIAK